MNVIFKILAIHPETRSVTVNYYTEVLLDAQKPIWNKRIIQLVNEGATVEAAETQAYKEYPAGTINHVTIWPDPMPAGDDLIEYLLAQAPLDWLRLKSEVTVKLPDMSALTAHLNVEHTVEVSLPNPVPVTPTLEELLYGPLPVL